jgi:hypothetical protein
MDRGDAQFMDNSTAEWAATGSFVDDLDPDDGYDCPEEAARAISPEHGDPASALANFSLARKAEARQAGGAR